MIIIHPQTFISFRHYPCLAMHLWAMLLMLSNILCEHAAIKSFRNAEFCASCGHSLEFTMTGWLKSVNITTTGSESSQTPSNKFIEKHNQTKRRSKFDQLLQPVFQNKKYHSIKCPHLEWISIKTKTYKA